MTDRVAIVIPTMNRRDSLKQCLASIHNLSYLPVEVIVVDNGSSDGTTDMLRSEYPDVHVIRKTGNHGVSGGRNICIRYAFAHLDCRYFLFLDDDATIEQDALTHLCQTMCFDEQVGLVTPKRYVQGEGMRLGSAGGHEINFFTGVIRNIGASQMDVGQYDRECDVQSAGGIVLIRDTVFRTIGLYDESFNPYGWEDVDLSLRARAARFRIRYQPRAIVYHAGGKLGRHASIPQYEQSKARNYLLLMRRHSSFLQWCVLLLVLPLRGLAGMVAALFRGNSAAARAILTGGIQAIGKASGRRK